MAISTFINASVDYLGDGVASVFSYDLANYPFSTPFNKTFPDSVVFESLQINGADGQPDSTYTVALSIVKSVLTATFNKPPVANNFPAGSAGRGHISFAFTFNG